MKTQVLLNTFLAPVVAGTQVANFNVSASIAAQYGCNDTCYEAFSAGIARDFAEFGAVYDVDFYATAKNFSSSAPGDILKFEPINSKDLTGSVPPGISAYRIQYTSVDLSGNNVPATGFVVFPYANRKNSHFYRTVAWAHGTSGVFRGCAPSAMPDLYEYDSWALLVERGYAVIATDYAGLGNNYTGHPYSALSAHANDVFYSVAASRKIWGASLTKDWMSVGHSEGGGAVWSLAESPLVRDGSNMAGNYLGTVAQAPGVFQGQTALAATEAAELSSSSDLSSSTGVLGELGWAVIGLQNLYPNETFNWLDSTYRQRLELARRAQACYDSMEAIATGLNIEEIIDLSDPKVAMQALRVIGIIDELSAVGGNKSYQPLLVVQGLEDTSVSPEVTEYAWNATCEVGSEVHLQLYPGLEHDPVIPASAPYFLQWMDDRFDGVETTGKCSKLTVKPFDAANFYAPVDED
ncbi:alpha/beta-hydrolase [Didymella exigua CBS 183.55]|uniref:Alpha/beta-hydrolase n=1 Tax=Didymella exigua CBS 183.55 TaxID=1150837 RepID=A0A6A5RD25_9PLEO|nr:alpha/beta-hydrolase [Didymella exigua CBS 183.55]KAF1925373.1 alpha/beta-hydrolase [Didymella exigua CBS 183.55]